MFREGVYRIRGRNKGDDRGRVIVERKEGDDKSREREEGDDKSREREGSLHRSSCRSHRRAPPLDSRCLVLDQCQTSERLLRNPMVEL